MHYPANQMILIETQTESWLKETCHYALLGLLLNLTLQILLKTKATPRNTYIAQKLSAN